MDRTVYDTREGIASKLTSYADLYALFRARHAAHYDRGERLQEFVILGRFFTDPCGNWWTMRFEKPLPPAAAASLPSVMTRDEFHDALRRLVPDAMNYSAGTSTGPLGALPPPQMTCARCGQAGWTLENCHEFEAEDDQAEIPLDPYVGKTLAEVEVALQSRTDGIYSLHASVRNDRWINPDGRLGREHGWRSDQDDDDPISMDHVVAPGDETSAFVIHFYHAACHAQIEDVRETVKRDLIGAGLSEMMLAAGFTGVRIEMTKTPAHLLEWAGSEDPDDFDPEALEAECAYYRVTTDQGSLGVWKAAYLTIDLTGTGIELKDIAPEMADAPDGFPPILGLDGEPAVLLKLWQLMVKRQAAPQ